MRSREEIKREIEREIWSDIKAFSRKDDMAKLMKAIHTGELDILIDKACDEYIAFGVDDEDAMTETLEYEIYLKFI